MKVYRPKGLSAIIYYIFSFVLVIYFIFLLPLIYFSENKIFFEILPILIIMDIASLFGIYLLISSVSLKIIIFENKLRINSQWIPKRNRIQYSCNVEINSIDSIKIVFDEFDSRGKKFISLNPTHIYQKFIAIYMKDGNIYKLWVKHFSEKQINEIINLLQTDAISPEK